MTSFCILIKMSKHFRFCYFKIVQIQNGFNKVAIELVISNRTSAQRSFDFEITRMISDLTICKQHFL